MKKLLLAATTSIILASSAFSANPTVGLVSDMGLGVGAQFNGNINTFIGSAGVSGDYLFLNNKKLGNSPFTWYVGAGAGYFFGDWGAVSGDIDLRLPVGIDWDFHKEWDAFAQLIPSLRISDNIGLGVNGAIGVRYKF